MTPLAAKLRQPGSPEWRRRSLVRVRRPAWVETGSETVAAHHKQAPQPEASSPQTHTTSDDIAW